MKVNLKKKAVISPRVWISPLTPPHKASDGWIESGPQSTMCCEGLIQRTSIYKGVIKGHSEGVSVGASILLLLSLHLLAIKNPYLVLASPAIAALMSLALIVAPRRAKGMARLPTGGRGGSGVESQGESQIFDKGIKCESESQSTHLVILPIPLTKFDL